MPRRAAIIFAIAAISGSAGLCAWAAQVGVGAFETVLVERLTDNLEPTDDWLEVSADGATVTLAGTAPDEEARRGALGRLGSLSLGAVLDDRTGVSGEVAPEVAEAPAVLDPQMEILVARDGTTVMGTMPSGDLENGRVKGLARDDDGTMVIAAAVGGTPPDGWERTRTLATESARAIDLGRVGASTGAVAVTTSAPPEAEPGLRASLRTARPEGVALRIQITTQLPLITPFEFRAVAAENGIEVETCAAPSTASARRIAERVPEAACQVGLGAPSAGWTDAVVASLGTLAELEGGRLTLSDGDIALEGPAGHAPEAFTEAVDRLAALLPEGFSLTANLPAPPETDTGPAEPDPPRFVAEMERGGALRIEGHLADAQMQATVRSFARAKFGFDAVDGETDLRENLPSDWSGRVLGGIAALAEMQAGRLEVTMSATALEGSYAGEGGAERVRAALTPREGERISLALTEVEPIEVARTIEISPQLCADRIALVLDGGQIVFPPSETEIDGTSLPAIDRIAEILLDCPGARFEIGGHTDSQGGEGSNQALSQARANAVLTALLERGIDTVFLHARGYGETAPIAPNDTETGRAANRRIEFRLLTEAPEDTGAAEAEAAVLQAAAPAVDDPAEDDAVARLSGRPEAIVSATSESDAETALAVEDAESAADTRAREAAQAEADADPDFAQADTSDDEGPMRPRKRPEGLEDLTVQ